MDDLSAQDDDANLSQDVDVLIDQIADDFLAAGRTGDPPSIDDFVASHPKVIEFPGIEPPLRRMLETLRVFDRFVDTSAERSPTPVSSLESGLPQIDDYRLLRVAGRGGMGVVYEATQLSLSRKVALKVLPEQLFGNPQAIARFQLEARSAAQLHHTNIVPVFEVGKDGRHCFYAMQYIEGNSLDVVIRQLREIRDNDASRSRHGLPEDANEGERNGASHRYVDVDFSAATPVASAKTAPLSALTLATDDVQQIQRVIGSGDTVEDSRSHSSIVSSQQTKPFFRNVARFGRQIADGLQHAHERGIVHRDIKPSNIILDSEGVAWITDFGLAKTEDTDLTRDGDVVGTLRYMPPERFEGTCDAGSDVYSLGVTLYEMLALQSPFALHDRASLISAIRDTQPTPLRTLNHRVPRDLQTIVDKAMEKEPRRRYRTAAAMADDLERFLDGRPIRARRVGTAERLWLWSKNNVGLAASIAAIALMLVCGAIGSTFAAIHFRSQEQAQAQLVIEKAEESKKAKEQRDIALQNAYYADIKIAHQDWQTGEIRRMLTTLQRYVPSESQRDVRGWEWYYLVQLANQDAKTILDHDGPVTRVRWSPDGERLFSGSRDNTLRIWDRRGDPIRTIEIPGLLQFAINADASKVAVVSVDMRLFQSALMVFDSNSGELVRRTSLGKVLPADIQWNAEKRNAQGTQIAVCFKRLPTRNYKEKSFGSRPVTIFDADTLKIESEVTAPDEVAGWTTQNAICFSPHGEYLAIASALHSGIWHAQERRWVNTIRDSHIAGTCIAWHPNSRQFAVGRQAQGVSLFEVAEDDSLCREIANLEQQASVDSVEFSPDGLHLAIGSRSLTVELYRLKSNERVDRFRGHLGAVLSTAWHPRIDNLVSCSLDGSVKFWKLGDARTTTANAILPADTVPRTELKGESPDGRWRWNDIDGLISVYDTQSDSCVFQFRGPISRIDFKPQLNWMVVRYPRQTMTWDTRTWKPVSEATLLPPVTRSTVDHLLEASVDQDELMKIVNFDTGEIQRRYTDRFETDRKFLISPNGQFLATSVAGCVSLWNVQPFEIRARFFGHAGWSHASALAWDHQSRFLATSGSDQVIRVWDAQNCKLSMTLTGLQGNPTKLEFSVDDSRLMSRGKKIRIWDIAQGREVISFDMTSLGPDENSFALSADDYKSMLSNSNLNFANLEKANSIDSSDREVEQFEIEMLGHLAPIMTMNPQFPGHEPKDGLKIAFKAVDFAPENADLRMTLAVALLRNNRFEEAIRAAQARDRMTNADDGFSVLLQAIANWKLGHTELASQQLNRGIQMIPESPNAILDYRVIANEAAKLITFSKQVETGHRRSITVTTLDDELDGIDDGKISLREAILSAGEGGVIKIHDEGTITLQYGQLLIDKSVTINGPGADKLTLTQTRGSRLVTVNDADDSRYSNVSFSGMRFTKGVPIKDHVFAGVVVGGAIWCAEHIKLIDCVLENNRSHLGSGVYLAGGSHGDFSNCIFRNNNAVVGGAVYVVGGKFGRDASLDIHGCRFESNSCVDDGSAIFSRGSVAITNSHFAKNRTASLHRQVNPGFVASCISVKGSRTSLANCTIIDNQGIGLNARVLPSAHSEIRRLSIQRSVLENNSTGVGRTIDLVTDKDTEVEITGSIIGKAVGFEIDREKSPSGIDRSGIGMPDK